MNNNRKYSLILSIIFMFFILIMYFCFTLERVILTKGFSNIDYIIYASGIVVILVLTIYLDIYTRKEISDYIKKKNNSLKENVKDRLAIKYKIRNFSNEEDEYYTKEDCGIFTTYDAKVEVPKFYIEPYGVEYDYILRMERKNKEIIFFGNESEEIEYGYRRHYKIYHMNFGILKEIDHEKRLHIKTKEYIPSKIKNFEDVFEDLEENVKEVDKKYKKEYESYFNRKYITKENEYIKLNDSQKEFLLELYKQTKLNFTLVLDNGLMRIYANTHGYLTYYTKIDENVISEQISNIFIKLIEEF